MSYRKILKGRDRIVLFRVCGVKLAMRRVLLLIAIGLLLVEWGGVAKPPGQANTVSSANVSKATVAKPHVDFDTQVKTILESKCMPCHFSGGQMYDRLPFDKPATIRKLGAKLFTRIKDEDQRRVIEDFLAQTP
jgi:hypothetical protein